MYVCVWYVYMCVCVCMYVLRGGSARLLQEELMRRIQENEQLHRTIAGERKSHQQELLQLQQRMAEQVNVAGGHAKDLQSVRLINAIADSDSRGGGSYVLYFL